MLEVKPCDMFPELTELVWTGFMTEPTWILECRYEVLEHQPTNR